MADSAVTRATDAMMRSRIKQQFREAREAQAERKPQVADQCVEVRVNEQWYFAKAWPDEQGSKPRELMAEVKREYPGHAVRFVSVLFYDDGSDPPVAGETPATPPSS